MSDIFSFEKIGESSVLSSQRKPKLTLLADIPEDVLTYMNRNARLEPSVPNGYFYAYTADVDAATRVVRK